MRKRLLSSLFAGLLLFAGASSMFTSCKDYDDDIERLQEQIDLNAKAIDQLNNLITDGSVIKEVRKVANGIEVVMSNGNTYTITNGTDAVVWTIGDDGYWYKDGEKTDYYAIGKDGANGIDGTNGTDGKDGKDGKDGIDGIYYVPNSETGCWDIYNGDGSLKEHTTISWKASMSNVITAVMDGSDLKLYNVMLGEGYTNVTVALSNALRGFVFKPEVYVDGVPAIRVSSYGYRALKANNKDKPSSEKYTESGDSVFINPKVYAYYHVNPTNANVDDLKNLTFVVQANDEYVVTRRAPASNDFNVTAKFADFKDGILKVEVNVTGKPATNEKISVVALQTTKENGENVTSDYATVIKKNMVDLRIADKDRFARGKDYHYRRYLAQLDNEAGIPAHTVIERDVDNNTCDLLMYFDETIDIDAYVEAHELLSPHKIADLEALGMEFKYEIVNGYTVGDPNNTDQAEYVEWVNANHTILKVKEKYGTSAIDRTPIVRVLLMDGNKVVKVAYIKIKIARKGVLIEDPSVTITVNDFVFECGKNSVRGYDYKTMSLYILAPYGFSKDEFHEFYPIPEDYIDPTDVGTVAEGPGITEEGTNVLEWTISNNDLWNKAGQTVTNKFRYYTNDHKHYFEIILKAVIEPVQKTYNVTTSKYISNYWDAAKTYARFNVAVPQSTSDDDPSHCIYDNDLNSPFVTNSLGVIDIDSKVTDIEYFFCKNHMNNKNIAGENVTISSNGLQMFVGSELIATIINGDSPMANHIVLNKSSEKAKKMLNTKNLEVYIQAVGYVCGNKGGEYVKKVNITFNGEDHFVAKYIRPIEAETLANEGFIDGVDFGECGSMISMDKLVVLHDWRNNPTRYFSEYPNYWGYYGPFSFVADLDNAKCDLDINGDTSKKAIPSTIELKQVSGLPFDLITYKNNGTVVNKDFNIFVKVKVNYGWGTFWTDEITVPVKSTITPAGAKRH